MNKKKLSDREKIFNLLQKQRDIAENGSEYKPPVIVVPATVYKKIQEMVKQGIKLKYPFEWYHVSEPLPLNKRRDG